MLSPETLDHVDYGLDPSALILGAAAPGLADAAAAAGFRLLGHVAPAAAAAARLDRQVDVDLVLLGLDGDGGADMDLLVDRVAEGARAGRFRSIIVLPPAIIDAVAARIVRDEAELLVDPAPIELALALGIAARPRDEPMLHDVGAEGSSLRLIELTEEVGRLARQLATLAEERHRVSAPPPPVPPAPAAAGPVTEVPVVVAAPTLRAMIRARRVRDQFFRADMFADPAWDILLDLAAARKEGREVPVSSLCIAAAVPPTTALRWIRALTDDGLLVRRADPHDGRRVFVTLSDAAAEAVDSCVIAMRRAAAV